MTIDTSFPDGDALPTGMEIAFGADIDGDQDLWSWSDVTPPGDSLFMRQTVTTTRGRQNESSDVAPTGANVTLDNPDGELTPDNPASTRYPNVDLGTPARWWINASGSRVYIRPTPGSNAQVASTAALDIADDIDVRIDMYLRTMDPSGSPAVIVGRADDDNSYSWRIEVHPDRTVTLSWSETGLTPPLTITSTVPVVPMSARSTLRVVLDVDNGAGGRTANFYVGDAVAGTFVLMDQVTQAGTTSIANVTEPLIIGAPPDRDITYAPDVSVYAFLLEDDVATIADAFFTGQPSGTTSFVDDAGLTWNISSAAELSNRWFRIVGTIDEWAPRWPWGDLSAQQDGGLDEGQARVELAIAGILRRLGQGQPALSSAMNRAIRVAPELHAYWPMEDLDGSTQIASAMPGVSAATFSGEIDFAADSDLIGSAPVIVLTDTSSISGTVTGSFNKKWQVDWYIHADAGPVSDTTIMAVSCVSGGVTTSALWTVVISSVAVTVTSFRPNGTVFSTVTGAPTDMFGHWTHLRLTVETVSSDVNMTFEWTPVTFPVSASHSIISSAAGSSSDVIGWTVPPGALLDGIGMGHLSVTGVPGADVAGDSDTGYWGEVAAERIARLCAEEGVRFRVIGEMSTTEALGPQRIATLLTLLDDAENADGGILYEMPDAVGLIYRTRESMYNQPPNLVLDAVENQIQNPFAPILDDQRLRNSVTVTRQDGSSFTVVDQPSINKRGIYPEDPTLSLAEDSQLGDVAGWLLHRLRGRGMRYPQLTTNLGVAPEVIDGWLTVDQGAQVHVISLPPQHPTAPVRVIVEGYTEPISPMTWEPAANCSPASVWDVATLDGIGVADGYLLRLETDESQLAEDIDTTDTAFQVAAIRGPRWVTDPTEFPFDIAIGGEQMTVTDIDAATGGAELTGAATGYRGVNTVSHVAPSVNAVAAGDLLVCVWQSADDPGDYTVPVGMTGDPETDGTQSTMRTASETLVASGATGTRTATFSTPDQYSAASIAIHAGTGSPTVSDYQSGYSTGDVILTTSVEVQPGDWLMAIQGVDDDFGEQMQDPSGGGWISVADSIGFGLGLTSHTRVWGKRISEAGIYSVTFFDTLGNIDNHARLYVIEGLVGFTQLFTVTRSVNGVIKSHSLAADVRLWNTPVLAR